MQVIVFLFGIRAGAPNKSGPRGLYPKASVLGLDTHVGAVQVVRKSIMYRGGREPEVLGLMGCQGRHHDGG